MVAMDTCGPEWTERSTCTLGSSSIWGSPPLVHRELVIVFSHMMPPTTKLFQLVHKYLKLKICLLGKYFNFIFCLCSLLLALSETSALGKAIVSVAPFRRQRVHWSPSRSHSQATGTSPSIVYQKSHLLLGFDLFTEVSVSSWISSKSYIQVRVHSLKYVQPNTLNVKINNSSIFNGQTYTESVNKSVMKLCIYYQLTKSYNCLKSST